MMIGNKEEYTQAYTEISCLLNYMPEEFIDKLPKKLVSLIYDQSDEAYYIPIDTNKTLIEHNFSKKTKDLIAVLKYNYWSTVEEKVKLKEFFKENELKYQEMLVEKYNPDNIFKGKKKQQIIKDTNLQMIEYKESFFDRIINKIKSILKKIRK